VAATEAASTHAAAKPPESNSNLRDTRKPSDPFSSGTRAE
jgi:hypothetical protein